EGQVFYGTVFDPDARDELSVTVIATGLTRNSADATETVKRPVSQSATRPANHAAHAVVEDDDVPAIQRQNNDAGTTPAPAVGA
nr:hypothetical protein [Bifidobacterium bifidum]